MITRRTHLKNTLAHILAAAAGSVRFSVSAYGQLHEPDLLSRESVWHDTRIPVLGNPDGDLTVVEYFDYQCPICKQVHPELMRAIREDGKVRLVSKGWPILGGSSITAARTALAAKYQGKYAEAHEALFTSPVPLTGQVIQERLAKAGLDWTRLDTDLKSNRAEIDSTLARNDAQATALGFQGTPAFLVDKFMVDSGLDAQGFRAAFAEARAASAHR